MRTIICGGRDYEFTVDDWKWLDGLRLSLPITEVVSGKQSRYDTFKRRFVGADYFGEKWAAKNNIAVEGFPAEWVHFGRSAGPRRNQEMADYADACIAFPGGNGTADMVRRAREKNLRVILR